MPDPSTRQVVALRGRQDLFLLKVTFSQESGHLRDENGELITEALTRFQRLAPAIAIPKGNPQYLLDRFRVAYQSCVGPDFHFEG